MLGHAVLHHLPDLERAFAEFHRVLRPGGRIVFAGEPSRFGDRLARLPKRGAERARAAVARAAAGAARARRPAAPGRGGRARPRARARASTSTPSRPGDLAALRRAGRVRRGPGSRRGAGRQLVRLVQPSARGQRRPRATCRCCGASTPSTATCCCSGSTSGVLEPRLPPALFYNLLLSAPRLGLSGPRRLPRLGAMPDRLAQRVSAVPARASSRCRASWSRSTSSRSATRR